MFSACGVDGGWPYSRVKRMGSEYIRCRPGRSTGPTSREGKERSSGNRLTHGLRCSKHRVLKGESQAEYEQLWGFWLQEYQDDSPIALELIEEVVGDHWMLKRAERRVLQVEAANLEVNLDAGEWPDELHKKLSLMQRYRNTAKRDFERSRRAVEHRHGIRLREQWSMAKFDGWVKDREDKGTVEVVQTWADEDHGATQESQRQQRAALQRMKKTESRQSNKATPAGKEANEDAPPLSRADTLFQGQNSPKKRKKLYVLEQWVEVTIEDGKTVTTLHPSNQNVIERGKKMWPRPDLVYRRMNFPHGVPPEYDWVGLDPVQRQYGGCGIQRMTIETWLQVIEREAPEVVREGYRSSIAPEHIGPTGNGNLPRPKERGGCECAVCVANQVILDREEERKGG